MREGCHPIPTRAEAPCELARYFRFQERWNLARHFGQIAAEMPETSDILFVDRTVREWRGRDEWSIAAYWSGDFALSARLCRELLADKNLPEEQRARVQQNLQFAVDKLRS